MSPLPAPDGVPTVLLHVWRVRSPARALLRMGLDQVHLRRSGATFWQLLGTAGAGFGLRDADLHRWALLTCWPSREQAVRADDLVTVRGWERLAVESARLELRPVGTRGRWDGRAPFGPDSEPPAPGAVVGPVAAITRARLGRRASRDFRASVAPVAGALSTAPGLRFTMGIGERPTGLLGTFSVWEGDDALRQFAHHAPAHVAVARQSRKNDWFAEELFSRFAVVDARGTLVGRSAADLVGPADDGPPT